MSVSFPALGTLATIAVTPGGDLGAARAAVARELAAFDAACSRFRPDSELSRLVAAGGRPFHAGPILFDAMQTAVHAARVTQGLVDPTVGRTLRLAGYDATFRIVAARDGDTFHARFAPTPGWQTIELDEAAGTIRIRSGVELDLGATAKALAADRCARTAAAAAHCGVLVSLGGDIAVAGPGPSEGWPVGIADSHAAEREHVHTTVAIASGGLATSSTTVRRWRSGQLSLHHVIDPRTGRPADARWRTVSVAGASCVDANIASTAAIVLGDDARAWLRARGLAARLVGRDGTVEHTGGWPSGHAVAA